ncbi:hypothetical protein ACHAXH_008102 [Discostella pseudostelligera]
MPTSNLIPATRSHNRISASSVRQAILLTTTFLFGVVVCSAFFLWHAHNNDPLFSSSTSQFHLQQHYHWRDKRLPSQQNEQSVAAEKSLRDDNSTSSSILDGLRVLVTIASFDFMQLAHLEEVLDGFQDLCYAGSMVDIVVYTTVMYPVALIDMFNDRMRCNNPSPNSGLTMTLMLKPSRVRLHLVDFHRELFYNRIGQYDLFIYTEDDIRISPKTVAAYLHETKRVESMVGPTRATDFNVGIVRYEYDFPDNVVITDKTRHASVNVTRVYWEHLGKPIFDQAVTKVEDKALSPYYVSMQLSHQGMYLVTPTQLNAWKDRANCRFNNIRDRPANPNKPSQPTEGTQRVWMSSQMMYGGRHCNITQLLPVENFGQLTVLHLPNKNYRRVGKQGRLGGGDNSPKNEFSNGTEVFQQSHPDLLKALALHIELKRQFPNLKTSNIGGNGNRYTGLRVVDTDIQLRQMSYDQRSRMENQLEAYRAYVERGGYMINSDMDVDIDAWRTSDST